MLYIAVVFATHGLRRMTVRKNAGSSLRTAVELVMPANLAEILLRPFRKPHPPQTCGGAEVYHYAPPQIPNAACRLLSVLNLTLRYTSYNVVRGFVASRDVERVLCRCIAPPPSISMALLEILFLR